jgi:hypothetical protein
MNSRYCLLCIVSIASWVAATAYAAPVDCHGNDCNITITVHSCDDIVADPDGLATDHPVNLRWTIVTPGYNFEPGTGIQLSDPQFEVKHAPKPNQFHIHDNKSTPGTFPYQVNIAGCASADPYIQNR